MDDALDAFSLPVKLRRELLGAGWHDREIAARIRAGDLVRPRRGAYVDAPAWLVLDSAGQHVVMTRAVVKQAETDVVVSHSSAVPWHEGATWQLDLSQVHTTRTDGRTGRKEAGVHQHCGRIIDGDVQTVHGVQVMSPTRTALEVSTEASTEASLVVLCDFLHRDLTTAEAVRSRYEATMEHWPNSRATDIVIRLADPRISSVLEARFWYFCFRAGLPRPIPQYEVRTPDGILVAVLDFAWPDLGAYVETNGKFKYLELVKPGQRPGDVIEAERRREEDVHRLTRWRALHLGWADIKAPRATERRVREHLWPGASYAAG